ncbi:MAG: ABC transporter substrate-binding protein [Hyphomicrobiales bacterium]|nr:ABC transporter substrate-binding protein [Hyphomicrobiales bacterium]
MNISSLSRVALGAATTLALLVGSAELTPSRAQQSVLRIGLQEDPDMLDPHRARTFVGRIVFKGLCDKLFDASADLQLIPRLATEWSFSADGLTATIKLRAGVKFHDGTAFDAASAKANLDRARTLPESLRRSELATIDSVEVIDPLTIAIKLKQRDATLLSQLADRAGMMLSPATFAGDVGARPVCTGPYRFVERVQNDRIVLEKFADHWEAANYSFDRVIYRSIPDTTVRLANLRSGELDMIERLAATDVKSAQADRNLRVIFTPGLGYQGATLNLNNGDAANTPFGKDKRVRQAFSWAIDRAVLNQVVFEGTHTPTMQAFPPSSPYFRKDLPATPRDVAKARALLREAGVTTPLKLEMMITNNPVDAQLGQMIQAMVQEAGFDLSLRSMEFATQLRDQQQGRFQISRVGWSGRIDPDGNVHPFWTTGGGQNDGKYSNPEVDRLLNAARAVYSLEERKKLYDAAQTIANDEMPVLYLYNQPWYYATSARISGFQLHPDGMIRLAAMKRQ